MDEFRPRSEDEMAAMLERLGVLDAYLNLARAATRGAVSHRRRREIEAEAIRKILQVKQAHDEFAFPVAPAVEKAAASLEALFAKAKVH